MSEETIKTEGSEQTADVQVEERAVKMGWAPKEDFRGDESNWVDAETFVKRAENSMPILKENLRRMEQKLDKMESTNREFAEYHRKTLATAEERAYKKAETDIRREMKMAVKEGDVVAFERLEGQMQELNKSVTQKAPPQSHPEDHPDFSAWHKDNTWYREDFQLTEYADKVGLFYAANHKLDGKALFEKVAKEVKKAFPTHEVFSDGTPSAAPVSGEPSRRGAAKTKRGYNDLPSDAKQACDKFVKDGLMTKEQYVQEYSWEQ